MRPATDTAPSGSPQYAGMAERYWFAARRFANYKSVGHLAEASLDRHICLVFLVTGQAIHSGARLTQATQECSDYHGVGGGAD